MSVQSNHNTGYGIYLGLFFAIFGVLSGKLTIAGLTIIGSSQQGLILGGLILLIAGTVGFLRGELFSRKFFSISAQEASLCILILVFSDWVNRGYSLFSGPYIRAEWLAIFLLGVIFKLRSSISLFILPLAIITLSSELLTMSQGSPISADDHGSFLYRMMLLKDEFPSIPFYMPLWNGGLDSREYFATGAIGVFMLFSPLIYLFSVPDVYTLIVTILVYFILPVSVYLGARVLKLNRSIAGCAGIFALAGSFLLYRWALSYGTLGFMLSMGLAPLNFALCYQLLAGEYRSRPWWVVVTGLSISLMLFWIPITFAFFPLVLMAGRNLFRKEVLTLGLALLLIHLPWVTLFTQVSKVTSFVEHNTNIGKPKKRGEDSAILLSLARENAVSTNPAILLAVPGVMLLPRVGLPLGVTLVYLFVVGLVGPLFKPGLELERFLVVGVVFSSLPLGVALHHLLSNQRRRTVHALGVVGFATVIVGLLGAGTFARDRSVERLWFEDAKANDLVKVFQDLKPQGRVLFTGFILHEFAKGHIAPLPLLAPGEYIAKSPFHDTWRYEQSIPAEFMPDRITDYLDMMNVEFLAAHEPRWREYLRNNPESFSYVTKGSSFLIYRYTKFKNSWTSQGSAKRTGIQRNSISFTINDDDVVLRYRYFPFLKAEGCTLSAEKVFENMSFIRVKGCAGKNISISSINPYQRLRMELGQ